jgi:hypothetical protein
VARRLGQAGQVDRDPQRVADDGPPRPRPDPVHRHRRRPRGQRQGPALPAPRRHGRLPAADHPGVPVLGRFMFTASTSSRPTASSATASSPTRCPPTPTAAPASRGDLRRRADHGRARRRAGMDPLELRRKNWIRPRSSRSPRWPG